MELTTALLLLLGVFGCCRGLEQLEECSGSDVTFLAAASGQPMEINWFKGNSKIVEVENEQPLYFYMYEDRVTVDLLQRTLILKNVTPADSGTYRAAVIVGGPFEDTDFSLRVDKPVCSVTIHNIIVQNNVTLQCNCSSPGDVPSKYTWYRRDGGSDLHVSDGSSITVPMEEKTQLYVCVGMNGACQNSADFTVPKKVPEPKGRKHIYWLIGLLLPVAIILGVILWCKKTNNLPKNGDAGAHDEHMMGGEQGPKNEVEGHQNLIHVKSEEPHTPCVHLDFHLIKEKAAEIIFKKADSNLMKIVQHLQSLCLEKLSVQQGTLKIMDMKEEDYAIYTAQVHPPIENCETFTWHASKLPKNGDAGAHEDQSETGAKLVFPIDGELKMLIRNAKKAEKITWKKGNENILTVTCIPDPLLDRLSLSKGNLSMALTPGDEGPYCAHVSLSDGTSVQHKFYVNVKRKDRKTELKITIDKSTEEDDAALGFDVTFLPVNVTEAKNIIWSKDGKTLQLNTTEEGNDYSDEPRIEKKFSQDSASGCLTIKNVEEKDQGEYIMKAKGGRTALQEFSLIFSRNTAF